MAFTYFVFDPSIKAIEVRITLSGTASKPLFSLFLVCLRVLRKSIFVALAKAQSDEFTGVPKINSYKCFSYFFDLVVVVVKIYFII
ncbi:MAG: hypothetical protein IPF72_10360 [Chitinophagaceae bacterium]|nr:hypothetical protein [Chitinophagaceae bacterium]